MTIKRAWEGLLEGAARSFLEHYWEDEYVDTDAEVEVWTSMLEKLTKRMKARFHDEWLTLRAEKVTESFADGRASLSLSRDGARELHRQLGEKPGSDGMRAVVETIAHLADSNPFPGQISKVAHEALDKQNWADAGHPDPEEAAAEADWRGDPAKEPSDDGVERHVRGRHEAARSGA